MQGGSYTKFHTKLADLKTAHSERLKEAKSLLRNSAFGSAIAYGIYAVEIYLKVRICERLDLEALPRPFQIHDLDGLLVLSGLSRRMDELGVSPIKANWEELTLLDVSDFRYKPANSWTSEQARTILSQIDHPRDGVLRWLKKQ